MYQTKTLMITWKSYNTTETLALETVQFYQIFNI